MSAQQVIELRPDDLTPAELQAAARDHYRNTAANGDAPTGADLGRRFGRSERWGRDRIAECRSGTNGNEPAAAPVPAGGSGSQTTPAAVDPAHPGTRTASEVPPPGNDNDVSATVAVPEGQWSRRVIRWVTTAAVIVVAACAARSSYEHQRTVVEMAGNHEAAWYLPLSVDGMMLIASLNMLVRRWDGQTAGALTWTALLLGGAASLAANIAAAEPTWIGRLVAAWSPVCLIVSYELLMQQLPNRAPAAATAATAAGVEGRQP